MSVQRISCRCGTVKGEVDDPSPGAGQRVVCYCDDCQTAAHALGCAELLDANGGMDIYQTTPDRVRWTEGRDQLRCLRLSPKGLYRFYAACCDTPLGNTLSPRVPFIGLPVVSLSDEARAAVGPVVARMQGRFAHGEARPEGVHPKAPVDLLLRTGWRLGGALIVGRNKPSPFFSADGALVVEPRVLTLEERQEFRSRIPSA